MLLATIGFCCLWVIYWSQYYFSSDQPDEIHFFTTEDGWRIALSRYRGTNSQQGSKKLPILCVHGLGANSTAWDLAPERSFAKYFNSRGWDVWSIDLRGHGRSEIPTIFRQGRYDWDFETFLIQELPQAIELICKVTNYPKLHWVGLSMGGVLGLSYLSLNRRTANLARLDRIASGVSIAASLDYSTSKSDYHLLANLPNLSRFVKMLPFKLFGMIYAPFANRIPNKLERFVLWEQNVAPLLNRHLYTVGFNSSSTKLLFSLASLFKPGGLVSKSCIPNESYFDLLKNVSSPVFFIAGDKDFQCPPDAVQLSYNQIGSKTKKIKTYGKEFGQKTHYGHFDLIIGDRVATEVFPDIESWLESIEAKF